MIPTFFLTLIIQLCVDRTKYVSYTGYMKKECLEIELDFKYMYGHMTITPRY